ncbi:MAG: putative toxin-antitoxin system toxin component, PIN family [Algoriphagus sp.]|nr:putative toxin-antitoxin system toxin component, PIN family [Algoriphagus sp.]
MTRVILDTNLWISYFLRSGNSPLSSLIEHEQLIFLWSEELVEELIRVSQRDKFRKYIPIDQLNSFLGQLQSKSELVNVQSAVKLCRDPADDFLLSLAKDGTADFLITGDKDLLALSQIFSTQILTLSTFIEQILNKH